MTGMISRKYHDAKMISSNLTPQHESSSDFLKHLKKTAKQAFYSKTNEYINTFLFRKLPVGIQKHLSVTGKPEASVDEFRDFIQKRYQYQPVMGTQQPQAFNEVSSDTGKRQHERPTRDNQGQLRKDSGTCLMQLQ